LQQNDNKRGPPGGAWPDPKLRAYQVDEVYRYAPAAAGMSYIIALLTLGVLIDTGDMGRGAAWFLWATAVTVFRFVTMILYRRRDPKSDPMVWGKLIIAGNFLAGIQLALLGTVLFAGPVYRELYILVVITCLVGGSLVAYAPLKWAHEALSLTAGIPLAVNLMVTQGGAHFYVGGMTAVFCFAIVYYARKHHRHVEDAFRLQIERDELLEVTAVLNEKLASENQELAHRAAVRGVSMENAREISDRLEALFEGSPLPQVECDASGFIVNCNPAAERLFAERREGLAGRPLNWLLAPAFAGAALEGATRAMNAEVEIRTSNGEAIPCTASFTPLPPHAGRQMGFGVIFYGLAVPVA
jgi:PAS domain S-box-containing protein